MAKGGHQSILIIIIIITHGGVGLRVTPCKVHDFPHGVQRRILRPETVQLVMFFWLTMVNFITTTPGTQTFIKIWAYVFECGWL